MTDGSIKIDTKIDSKQFDKDMQSIEKKLKKTSDNLGKMGKNLTTGVSLPIAGLFAGFAKSAMDLEATEAKYNTVFEGMTDQADEFISEFQKLTPATKAEAQSMASGLQDLLIPMGVARDEATDMTGEFMHVAGALANFNSGTHTSQDVMNAMNSALTGQYDSLKSLGIQLDATTVKEKAVQMGLASSTDEVDKKMQAEVLLSEVYAQSGDALNAYNEENLDAKTKMQLAKTEAIDLAASFGELLLPMINSLIDGVRKVIEWFSGFDEETQKTILTVLAVVAAIGPLVLIISKVIGGISSVIGFLTAMNPIVLLVIGVIIALVAVFTALWQENETFRTKVMEIWNSIKEFFAQTFEVLKEVFNTFITTIKEWWAKWGADVMQIAFDAFNLIYETLSQIFGFIKEVVSQFISTFQEWWAKWGEEIVAKVDWFFGIVFQIIYEVLAFVQEAIGEFISVVQGWWDKWGDTIMSVVDLAFTFIWETISNVMDTIINLLNGAFDTIKGVFETVMGVLTGDWDRAWDGMKDTVKGVANIIGGIVNGIIGGVETMVNAVGRAINKLPSFSIPDWVPVFGGSEFGIPNIPNVRLPRVPSLDVGTDRVKADGLAMLHKGESVVPADVVGGGYSNDNAMMKELIKALREYKPTINIEKIENNSDSDIPRILEQSQWILDRQRGRLDGLV
jgi:phage-related minor tail protein